MITCFVVRLLATRFLFAALREVGRTSRPIQSTHQVVFFDDSEMEHLSSKNGAERAQTGRRQLL